MLKLHTPVTAMESEKQKGIALKIRIKPHRKKMPEKNASSSSSSSPSSSSNRCGECGMSFPSTKALFGHLRIHRKNNRGSGNASFSTFRRSKHADVIAACVLMGIRRSKSEADIEDAKLIQLKWICAKIERQRKMKMKMKEATPNQSENYQSLVCEMATSMLSIREQSTTQFENYSSNEEVNAVAVVEMVAPPPLPEVEIHQCDKCDKVFNTGQALGGHKRAHYTGPPLCRPGSNGKSHAAVMAAAAAAAAEVAVLDFDLNEPAEEVFL